MNDEIEELTSSELGTKEYWEDTYKKEIVNYKNNRDVGEIWFDEDSQNRIISWILESTRGRFDGRIVDIGCGNGMFLIELAREGFVHLFGVDYSPHALRLASNIARDQNITIQYKEVDLLNSHSIADLGKFDIVHDKGTYDAVSLCPDQPKQKRRAYIENVCSLLEDNGLFIITSCNWTESELIASFRNLLEKHCIIPTPTFKFGGVIGNVVSSIVFKKLYK